MVGSSRHAAAGEATPVVRGCAWRHCDGRTDEEGTALVDGDWTAFCPRRSKPSASSAWAELTDEEIRTFLAARNTGVLGLPPTALPSPIPDGYVDGDRLLFSLFVGDSSRTAALSDAAEATSVLGFSAESPVPWESVLLTGTSDELPAEAWDAHGDTLADGWHLEGFEHAHSAGFVRGFEIRFQERRGLKYTDLPTGSGGKAFDESAAE